MHKASQVSWLEVKLPSLRKTVGPWGFWAWSHEYGLWSRMRACIAWSRSRVGCEINWFMGSIRWVWLMTWARALGSQSRSRWDHRGLQAWSDEFEWSLPFKSLVRQSFDKLLRVSTLAEFSLSLGTSFLFFICKEESPLHRGKKMMCQSSCLHLGRLELISTTHLDFYI